MAKTIMVQGTGSGVGKSVIATALCRIFLRDGFTVAPFKAQNMALNSYVTSEGGEIGRAQAVQARACGITPTVDMNPVLLKPTTDVGSQVIVRGRPIGNFSAARYARHKRHITDIVDDSFRRLADRYDIVVMEGAGSPAEINLKSHDIANMRAAATADAPVILVGDIDKGGVFAWLIGTIKLLDKNHRRRVKGFIINKFRGDPGLLRPGLKFLEKNTGIKVLGVIPYFKGIMIPEEDGIYRESRPQDAKRRLRIGVIKLPRISNHTDFDIFEREDVAVTYTEEPSELNNLDIVIIPGTKNTIKDMKFLRDAGFETTIKKHVDEGKMLVGICGGMQMLGKKILDPLGIESVESGIKGLGYFDFNIIFEPKKITGQVRAVFKKNALGVAGYEIHHGRTVWGPAPKPMFIIKQRGAKSARVPDGAYTKGFQVWGTNIHGIFDNLEFRNWFLGLARKKFNLPGRKGEGNLNLDNEIDRFAGLIRKNLDMKYLYGILNKDA
ncbi:MAG: cobyric acid synthase [Candidatus Omnitrophica bacterium]|nr:cobyric acid synthase [Candidatus Omnitrophota bacterium]